MSSPTPLTLGFEPTTGEETQHLHAPTAAAGLIGLLRSRGHRVLSADMAYHGGVADTTMLLVAHADAPSLFNSTPVQATRETQWAATKTWAVAEQRAGRRPLLDDSLANLSAHRSDGEPLVDYLTGQAWGTVPDLPNTRPLIDTTRAAALPGWWADRMVEGHTRGPQGSAALLLALLLPPPILGRLTYDPYDPDEPPALNPAGAETTRAMGGRR